MRDGFWNGVTLPERVLYSGFVSRSRATLCANELTILGVGHEEGIDSIGVQVDTMTRIFLIFLMLGSSAPQLLVARPSVSNIRNIRVIVFPSDWLGVEMLFVKEHSVLDILGTTNSDVIDSVQGIIADA